MKSSVIRGIFSVIILTLLHSVNLYSQGKGFSYQAVARDSEGAVLAETDMDVIVEIRAGSENGELIWQEVHPVTTSQLGLFSIVILGDPTAKTAGAADDPDEIRWDVQDYYLLLSLDDGNSVHDMGATLLQSVPLAKDVQTKQDLTFSGGVLSLSDDPSPTNINIAGEVATAIGWARKADTIATLYNVAVGSSKPNNAMLAVQGNDPLTGDALFEVRNASGTPVFSVYNEGVWVYVDPLAKGPKGGFAVGGYNASKKGPGQEFLRVTPDSTRVYFDENSKGPKGGFAVGGYNATKSSSQLMSLELTNYLIGHSAGINLTGLYNQFFGYQAGMEATSANYNVYMGYQAGSGNSSGDQNVTIGYQAGMSSTGYNNVLIGYKAGQTGTGYNNVVAGYQAGTKYIGNNSVIIGDNAGYNAVDGWSNVFIGNQAGYNNNGSSGTAGARNVFIGREAGYSNTTGGDNAYIGTFAGSNNVAGVNNVVLGVDANSVNGSGSNNVYMGCRSGYTNTGNYNVVLGENAGSASSNYTTAASYVNSTFVGAQAGYAVTTGDYNTFIGYRAGRSMTTGSGNVFIGYMAGSTETSTNNKFYLANNGSTYLLYGDFSTGLFRMEANVSINYPNYSGYGLIVDTPSDQTEYYALWVRGDAVSSGTWVSSDATLKTNIRSIDNPISKLLMLDGVYFDWDHSKSAASSDKSSVGVLAQDVEKVFPELVKDGPEGFKAVNYNGLIPVLIEAVKAQQAENTSLQEQLKQQEELIMELSKRLEALENK